MKGCTRRHANLPSGMGGHVHGVNRPTEGPCHPSSPDCGTVCFHSPIVMHSSSTGHGNSILAFPN